MQTIYTVAKKQALGILRSFPKAQNGCHFVTMKNGRKVFFDVFIRKYGLDGSLCKYKDADIYRRIKMTEFFEYILHTFDISRMEQDTYVIETIFHRLVIGHKNRNPQSSLELVSFYDINKKYLS